ncbi:fimbria/pilus outer membrane usher protein [Iodobacter fluviatilis]|uniref:fimbria/pilus outer membrane usher protein n=1 Tax=Iodobacter fluviatilis TaxID=537 RepID=UPI002278D319|nr:fimbria/pilus outer membrane usher protein [Iodobacter fluviatilis]
MEFNTDVLGIEERGNVDLSVFSKKDYILPGKYILSIKVNKNIIPEQAVYFFRRNNEEDSAEACFTPEIVRRMGLKEKIQSEMSSWHGGECANVTQLNGAIVSHVINEGFIQLSIPQAWMEYSDPNWVPPSFWDNGVPALLLDYNLNVSSTKPVNKDQIIQADIYGTAGMNAGPWRLRADFQGQKSSGGRTGNFDWSRYYAYRALPSYGANFTVGENYLNSFLFDPFRYTGAAIESDDRMLPASLQGYAPEIRGIAKTNARVTVSQNSYVLYETTVAAGPFNIQDLNSGVRGKLDVRVEEQDGSVQAFQVSTAAVPYLTRPGRVRYKVSGGKLSTNQHDLDGPAFTSGEFSYGIDNSWSVFGGAVLAEKYNAQAVGIGRDLYQFGAVSLDVSRSMAYLPDHSDAQGYSVRVNYAKRFDDQNSEITFAGYRFSDREFMSMDDFISAGKIGMVGKNNKEMYTVTANKSFADLNLSAYLSYNHQTFWSGKKTEQISFSASKIFDLESIKGISANLAVEKKLDQEERSNSVLLSLSVPFGRGRSISYSGQQYEDKKYNTISYGDYQNASNTWQLTAGARETDQGNTELLRGYYSHSGDAGVLNLNASYERGEYSAVSASVRGGLTITEQGLALHKQNVSGGTRLMLDTSSLGGVPINGGQTHSNVWGKAVVGDINSYYRTSTTVDVNQLGDDAEAIAPVVDATLTEGAVGYRKFLLVQGSKLMAVLSFANGSHPPFGAAIADATGREVGLVGEQGAAYLTGVQPGGYFDVVWSSKKCRINIPLTINAEKTLALLCLSE